MSSPTKMDMKRLQRLNKEFGQKVAHVEAEMEAKRLRVES